ncbi:MAG: hypothetical protein ACO1SV_05185 [Fimbriimonas sp.]
MRVVYYHPSDAPPIAGYEPRLNKILRYVEAYSGAYNLRLAFYHRDGEPTRRSATFRRNADGSAPVAAIRDELQKERRGRR